MIWAVGLNRGSTPQNRQRKRRQRCPSTTQQSTASQAAWWCLATTAKTSACTTAVTSSASSSSARCFPLIAVRSVKLHWPPLASAWRARPEPQASQQLRLIHRGLRPPLLREHHHEHPLRQRGPRAGRAVLRRPLRRAASARGALTP